MEVEDIQRRLESGEDLETIEDDVIRELGGEQSLDLDDLDDDERERFLAAQSGGRAKRKPSPADKPRHP